MKVTCHVKTGEFEFIELSDEVSLETPMEDIRNFYVSLKDTFAEKPGIDRKEFNTFIDNQLNERGNDINIYEQMSERQMLVVQEIKKAMARAESKGLKTIPN